MEPPDPTVCRRCGAVFHEGRWQWMRMPMKANRTSCPACQRVRDDHPAGIVSLTGSFVLEHREELRSLARHQEDIEKAEHALNRIMAIGDLPEGLEITTTDIHLPQRIGKAVERAYDGDLDLQFEEDRYFLRVCWSRDIEAGAAP